MAGFEIGSIFASLKLENKEAIDTLKETAKAAQDFGKRVTKGAVETGKKFGEALAPDPAKVNAVFATVKKKLRDFRRALGKQSQVDLVNEKGFLATLHRANLAVRRTVKKINAQAKIRLGLDPKKEITTFRLIEAAGKKAGRAVQKAFSGVRSVFTRLRRAAFGLQGVLLQIGVGLSGLALINRAKEVEQLRAGFDNLTRSIGGTADSFLGKLRKATRGAVSDLELMRTANNAILLGVAKNEDEFAELATVARRLGQAVGRDATDAINDLSIGIGRQSRLILDNLGLIVKVGEATDKYALSIGKNAEELTDAERRQAFFNAAMEAGRKKVAELGEDVPTLAQAWGRFQAAISNTVTSIAEAFVGPGGFNVIADWLEENQKKIAVFARFIARVVTGLFKVVSTFISSFFGESGSLGDFTERLFKFVADMIEFVQKLVFTGLGALFGRLGFFLIKLLALLFGQLAFALGEKIANLFNTLKTKVLTAATNLFAAIPGVAELLGLDDPEIVALTIEEIEKEGKRTAERIKRNASQANAAIKAEINSTVGEIGKELRKLAEEARGAIDDSADSGNTYAKVWQDAIGVVEENLNRLGLELADVGSEATDLRVLLPLQGLANELNAITALQKEGIAVASKYGDALLDAQTVKDQSEELATLRGEIVAVNDLFQELRDAPEGTKDKIEAEFIEAFEAVQQKVRDTSVAYTLFTSRLAGGAVQLGENREGLEGITKALKKLDEEFRKTAKTADVVDLALAPQFIQNEELNKLLEPLESQARKLEVEVQLVGLDDTEKQLKQLDIALTTIRKNQLSPEQTARVAELEKNLKGAIIRIRDLQAADKAAKAVETLDNEIAALNDQLKSAGADPLAKSLLDLDRKLEAVKKETGATGKALQELEERFQALRGVTVALRLDEFEKRLEESRIALEAVGQTEAEQKIAAARREFDRLSEVLADQPEKLARVKEILEEIGRNEIEIRFRTELGQLRREIEGARLELELIGAGPAVRAVRELDFAFEQLVKELNLNEKQAAELKKELEELKDLKIQIEVETNLEAARQEIKELQNEIEGAFVFDETEKRILGVTQDFRELRSQLEAEGLLTQEIDVQLKQQEGELKDKIREAANVAEFAELTRNISDSVVKGLVDGFQRGEKPSKVWANITSQIFANALEKTLEDLTNSITQSLGKIFESLGADAGVAGGLGGLATNLIGIAGLILQNLDDKSQTTIDDFEDQVNSSEAIRGVVAGPSNVAISKVNEGMKEALRTTEVLLERIAIAVEGSTGGGGGSSAGMRNAAFPLTGSSS